MKIDFDGVAKQFSTVPLGGFFMSGQESFGLCVGIDDTQRAAVFFPSKGQPLQACLYTHSINETLVHYPNAAIRLDPKSAAPTGSFPPTLILAGSNLFIRAFEKGYNYRTFDVSTGMMNNSVVERETLSFAQWSIGMVVDSKFEKLYSCPP